MNKLWDQFKRKEKLHQKQFLLKLLIKPYMYPLQQESPNLYCYQIFKRLLYFINMWDLNTKSMLMVEATEDFKKPANVES